MTTQQAIDIVRNLPDGERADLALELIRSLDPPGEHIDESEWATAWSAELDARAARYEAGESQANDWRVSMSEIRRTLQQSGDL